MVSHLVKILSVLSWNVQGMGDPDKCVLVRNSVLSMDPCLACLQETKLSHLNGIKRPAFLPPRLSDFATKDADGSHGGVVTAWDPRLLCLLLACLSLRPHLRFPHNRVGSYVHTHQRLRAF